MNLSDQVCSLEYAKKLKELGVKQDSIFYWSVNKEGNNESMVIWNLQYPCYANQTNMYKLSVDYPQYYEVFSAFTCAELIEMIPHLPDPHRISFGIENPNIDCGGKYYAMHDVVDYPCDHFWYSNNLANCIAAMLINLIETGAHKP